jgi:hypothetical protein
MKDSSDVDLEWGLWRADAWILSMDIEPGEGASEFHIHLPILCGAG